MHPITAPLQGASAAQGRPSLGEPSFNIAGTCYTAAQFQALMRYGSKEAGYYQLIPLAAFLAYLASLGADASEAATGTMNGPAYAVSFLTEYTGILWTALDEGMQPRLPGGPDIGPYIPYAPLDRFIVSLPECTPGAARSAILAYLAAQRIAA